MHKQLLLIDDDFDEQDIFKEAVKTAKISFKCFFANSAKQGIELLNKITPDFIFLDINMPAINGFECLDVIKKKDSLKQIPVIMYSTGIDERVTANALALGASACIKKEASIDELANTLKQILNYNSNSVN